MKAEVPIHCRDGFRKWATRREKRIRSELFWVMRNIAKVMLVCFLHHEKYGATKLVSE